MMLSLNKIVFLKKQKDILGSMLDLYGVVGIPTQGIQQKWNNNHALLLRERDLFNNYHQELLQLQNN
jgi:hypothetical protein